MMKIFIRISGSPTGQTMQQFKRRTKIPIIIAAALLCVAMMWLFVAMFQLVYFSEQKDQLDKQRYAIVALGKAITNAESGQRGYLLTGHTPFLTSLEQGRSEAQSLLQALVKDSVGFPQTRNHLLRLQQLVKQKFAAMDQGIQVQLHAGAYASHLSLAKDQSREIMHVIEREITDTDRSLQQLRAEFEQAIRIRIQAAVVGGVVLTVLIIAVLLFSYRSTTRLIAQVLENQAVAKAFSHQAEHDLLTNLPNRRSIEQHLQAVYQQARHGSRPFAILFMDLDGFKQVNDRYGHEVGDALLVDVAGLFKKVIRQSDFLARQGGDEFVLVVSNYLYHLELIQLAQRLIELFEQPVQVQGLTLEIGVSIGIAEYPHHGMQVKQLLIAADQAMYAAKKNGKNRYCFAEEI